MRVLFVCTANICRSPLASALFVKAAHLHGATTAQSASAGFLDGGRSVHESVVELLHERGVDVSRKASQTLTQDIVDRADLILTMTSEHARRVVSQFPQVIEKVYTQRHFGTAVTPRPDGVSTRDWLDGLNQKNRRSYLRDDDTFDIADPIGQKHKVFVDLAIELENSMDWIMGCAYPSWHQAEVS